MARVLFERFDLRKRHCAVEQVLRQPLPLVAMALRSASLLLSFCLVVLACYSLVNLVNGAGCGRKRHTFTVRVNHTIQNIGTFKMDCTVKLYGCQGGCDTEVKPSLHPTGDSDDYCKYDIECCMQDSTTTDTVTLKNCVWVDPTSPGPGYNTPTNKVKTYTIPSTCTCQTCFSGADDAKCQKIYE